ncbi:MAG: metal ABC transporter permease [Ignavibacteriales bacterium]|nr:metal ABC transporter permease [Ignavibacteriales bacterium]
MSDIEILRTIVTQFPFALIGSVFAGLLCGYLSVYVVSKRVVFVGATLTQVAVTGIAVAHLLFPHESTDVVSLALTLFAVVILAQLLRSHDISRDSVLGVSYVVAIALRILVIQKSPASEVSEIEAILKGDLLFITQHQLSLLIATAAVLLFIHLLFQKEFIFVSFDSETATTQGFKAGRWEMLFYATIGIAISVATRIVGDVFVFGFLVIPAVTATLLARKVRSIFWLSTLVGALPPIIGLYLAFKLDLPAGPTAVATASAMLAVSWIIKRFK